MKYLRRLIVAVSLSVMVACLVLLKMQHPIPAAPSEPGNLAAAARLSPVPQPISGSLPPELFADAAIEATVRLYLERKQTLLLQQSGFWPEVNADDDLSLIQTARQADDALARWATESEQARERQRQATAALVENEEQIKRAIGEQRFAELQAWEVNSNQNSVEASK